MREPRIVRNGRGILLESIQWDADEQTVLWSDITAGLLHRGRLDHPADGSSDVTLRLDPPLASFAQTDRGGFVVSLGDRIIETDAAGRELRELAAVDHLHAGLRLNEGKVDPVGRWVTGSMNMTTGAPDGAFYSVDASGSLRVLRGGIATANGLDWSPDGRRVYFTDTSVSTVYTAEYSADGEILEERVFDASGPHDGLTVDSDGGVWSAFYGEGRVTHSAPDGTVLETIELPVPNVTSVAFGGPDLSTLLVASARENMTEEQLEAHPLSGALFAVDTDVTGQPSRRFRSA